MQADVIPKIFHSFSNVLDDQFIDIHTSGAEQSNNISCSVVPPMRDVPTWQYPLSEMVLDGHELLTRGFSRKAEKLLQ